MKLLCRIVFLCSLVLHAPHVSAQIQDAYIKASNAGTGDMFGVAIDADGTTLVVGAPRESSNATGQDGDENNNFAARSGAVYIFDRSGTQWSQSAYVKAPNTGVEDEFGFSVSLSGNTLLVGAPFERSSALGVNGNQLDNSLEDAGAAYVYVRSGSDWILEAYLKASNTGFRDRFGWAVAVSGDVALVSAIWEQSGSSGVNGSQDDTFTDVGAVYAYVRSGTTWSQEAYLKPHNPSQSDWFGNAISLDGSTAVVGAFWEDGNSTGVNGMDTGIVADSGAAYVFERSGTTWAQTAYLKASNSEAGDEFGRHVLVSGDTIVVGSLEDSLTTGVNGNQFSNAATDSGAAYVFGRSGTSWIQEAFLKPCNTHTNGRFGSALAMHGESLLVGSEGEKSIGQGPGCAPNSRRLTRAGAAYLFQRNGSSWRQLEYLKASNTNDDHNFGSSVAITPERLLIGAFGESNPSSGINGAQEGGFAFQSGAVYSIARTPVPSVGTNFCAGNGGDQMGCTDCPCANNSHVSTRGGCQNSAGRSTLLEVSCSASVSLPHASKADLRFSLTGAPSNAFCFLLSAAALAPINPANPCFGAHSGIRSVDLDGMRCVVSGVRRHNSRTSDAAGRVGYSNSNNPWGGEGGPQQGIAQVQSGFVAGERRYFQALYRDDPLAVCMRGLNSSQAIGVSFRP